MVANDNLKNTIDNDNTYGNTDNDTNDINSNKWQLILAHRHIIGKQ